MFKTSDAIKFVNEKFSRIDKAIVSRLQLIGEQFVRDARTKTKEQGGFGDQTGNLRSSIGFVILKDGETTHEDFQLASGGTDRETGLLRGKAEIAKLKGKYPSGYVLLCVAGMEYAADVEKKNKDVITGSSLIAREALNKAIQTIKDKI